MAEFGTEKRVLISRDAPTMAAEVAARLLGRLARLSAMGRTIHVALTGGTSGASVLQAAGRIAEQFDIDWSRVHFWWGDERFVPRTDAERNDAAAHSALLDHIAVPEANVHAMASPDDGVDLDAAARAYADELARFGTDAHPWPVFDVCFLGVGADGHVASLFPDRSEIRDTEHSTVAVRDAPKPPSERISLTRPVINASKRVWMVLTGADKAPALGLALAGASYDTVPAAGAKGRKRTVFFVDDAAAAEVPEELIAQEY